MPKIVYNIGIKGFPNVRKNQSKHRERERQNVEYYSVDCNNYCDYRSDCVRDSAGSSQMDNHRMVRDHFLLGSLAALEADF